jgi:glycosyltransferase involved in cell wall biosynthesis
MKIVLYYPWIYLKSGIERTILNILKYSSHDYTVVTHYYDPESTYPEFKHYRIVQLSPIPIDRSLFSVFRAALAIMTTKLPLDSHDGVLIQNDGLADLITIRNHKLPLLSLCHTPLRPVFDPIYRHASFQRVPIIYKPLFLSFSLLFRMLSRILWRLYSYVIFVSGEVEKRALEGGLKTKESSVLHTGIEIPRHISVSYGRFFLLHGRIMWTKNIELGIKSFISFKKMHPAYSNFKLIIAGMIDRKSELYVATLKQLVGNRTDIVFLRNPTDVQLTTLLRRCYAGLLTAKNEDWGLTVLECFAYSKPVVAINSGGPLESIIHDRNGLLVKPDIASFSQAMFSFASNKEYVIKLGRNARKHVMKYDARLFVKRIDLLISEFCQKD